MVTKKVQCTPVTLYRVVQEYSKAFRLAEIQAEESDLCFFFAKGSMESDYCTRAIKADKGHLYSYTATQSIEKAILERLWAVQLLDKRKAEIERDICAIEHINGGF